MWLESMPSQEGSRKAGTEKSGKELPKKPEGG